MKVLPFSRKAPRAEVQPANEAIEHRGELKDTKPRIVIFGSVLSGGQEVLKAFEKHIEDNSLDVKVDITRWVEGIDPVFYDTIDKDNPVPPSVVIALPEMRWRDGDLATTINTPFERIQRLCEENGTKFIYIQKNSNEELAAELDKALTY